MRAQLVLISTVHSTPKPDWDERSLYRSIRPIQLKRLKIRWRASWSVRPVNLFPSRYGLKKKDFQAMAKEWGPIVSKFCSATLRVCDQYLKCLCAPSGRSFINTQTICLSNMKVYSVKLPLVRDNANTAAAIKFCCSSCKVSTSSVEKWSNRSGYPFFILSLNKTAARANLGANGLNTFHKHRATPVPWLLEVGLGLESRPWHD